MRRSETSCGEYASNCPRCQAGTGVAACFDTFKPDVAVRLVQQKQSMKRSYPSIEREKTIRFRQDPPQWGALYVPGQLATREEAPRSSRPAMVKSSWLGRYAHFMSAPELYAYLLGNWLGCFVDLHEGRMLHPEPSPGFLVGGPFDVQTYVGSHSGTICVAERLGLLKFHPTIKSERGEIAYPLLGDLLYFAKDNAGAYAVNWCIKNEPNDFIQGFKGTGAKSSGKSNEAHIARLLIEEEVFSEARIRTIQIALSDIPKPLRENLRLMYPYLSRTRSILDPLKSEFIEAINHRIPKQVPLIETIRAFASKHGGAVTEYLDLIYPAIWRMEIKCDLNRPIQIDLPLKPIQKDIKRMFDNWTKREIV